MKWRGKLCAALVFFSFAFSLALMAEQSCTFVVAAGSSIQEVVDGASMGDVICLAEGQWQESITIAQGITLRGQGPGKTIIASARSNWPAMWITAPDGAGDVSVEKVELTGSWGMLATTLQVSGHARVRMVDCVITGESAFFGVLIMGSAKVDFRACVVSAYGGGLMIMDDASVMITACTISVSKAQAVNLLASAQVRVEESVILTEGAAGIRISAAVQAHLEGNHFATNGGYAVALAEYPCAPTECRFQGIVSGKDNRLDDLDRAVCPDGLLFLFSEHGGELDRR